MGKQRLIGIIVLSTVLFLSSVAILIGPVLLTGFVFLVAFILIYIITGIGLLRRRNWARFMTMLVSPIVSYPIALFTFLPIKELFTELPTELSPADILIVNLVTAAITIGIIYYLTRPKVKEQFK